MIIVPPLGAAVFENGDSEQVTAIDQLARILTRIRIIAQHKTMLELIDKSKGYGSYDRGAGDHEAL